MAIVLVLDPSHSRSAFTLRAMRAMGHDARVLPDIRSIIESVARDHPDVVVLIDAPPRLNALDFVELIKLETGSLEASLIILAGEGRRKEATQAADLVLPLAATEELLTNAVRLVLQGRAHEDPASGRRRGPDDTLLLRSRSPDEPPAASGSRERPSRPSYADDADRTMVNGYRVIKPLGRGGMAIVYLTLHEATGEERVLKLLPISEHDGGDMVQRLINEAVLLAQVEHPGVARIYEHGFTEWHAYIAMEYLPGGELRAAMGRPFRQEVALDALAQIAAALGAVHAAEIVHRDLKPENVMRRRDGSYVLVDFGIARQEGVQLSYAGTGQVVGTASYLAPEYLKAGNKVDHRADLYSLGVMLYEMLTGRKPYESDNPVRILDMHVHGPVPRLPPSTEWAQPLLDRMMAKNPEERFQNASELLEAISSVSGRSSGGNLQEPRVA
ncbi:MAG: protein kinase [Betaproteobacteria bacterium]|nr:protein kinase [Betaproteobacteria bacterium]